MSFQAGVTDHMQVVLESERYRSEAHPPLAGIQRRRHDIRHPLRLWHPHRLCVPAPCKQCRSNDSAAVLGCLTFSASMQWCPLAALAPGAFSSPMHSTAQAGHRHLTCLQIQSLSCALLGQKQRPKVCPMSCFRITSRTLTRKPSALAACRTAHVSAAHSGSVDLF